MKRPRKRRPRRQGVRVEVLTSTEAIDFDAWAERYILHVLASMGYRLPADLAA